MTPPSSKTNTKKSVGNKATEKNTPVKKADQTHAGHRERIRNKVIRGGIQHFEDHEVLELLLFYAFPQKNTNPLAHSLIERFGSLNKLMEAEIEEIERCSGMGKSSAILIKTVMELAIRYVANAPERVYYYDSLAKVNRYVRSHLFFGATKELSYALLFDERMKLLEACRLGEGDVNTVLISKRKLMQRVLNREARAVILAHNHPNGVAAPSMSDVQTTWDVYNALKTVDVPLLEHIIVSGKEAFPFMKNSAQYSLESLGGDVFGEEFITRFFLIPEKEPPLDFS